MALGDNDGVIFLVAHKFPLSMGFSQQEYCNGMPFLPPGYLPNSGIRSNSTLLHLQHWEVDSVPLAPPGKPKGKTEKKDFMLKYEVLIWHLGWKQSTPDVNYFCVCVCVYSIASLSIHLLMDN